MLRIVHRIALTVGGVVGGEDTGYLQHEDKRRGNTGRGSDYLFEGDGGQYLVEIPLLVSGLISPIKYEKRYKPGCKHLSPCLIFRFLCVATVWVCWCSGLKTCEIFFSTRCTLQIDVPRCQISRPSVRNSTTDVFRTPVTLTIIRVYFQSPCPHPGTAASTAGRRPLREAKRSPDKWVRPNHCPGRNTEQSHHACGNTRLIYKNQTYVWCGYSTYHHDRLFKAYSRRHHRLWDTDSYVSTWRNTLNSLTAFQCSPPSSSH